MTKDDFLEAINFGRTPKYEISQIHEGNPDKEGVYLVGTESGKTYIGIWHGTYWNYTGFTSATNYGSQEIFESELKEKVIFYAH